MLYFLSFLLIWATTLNAQNGFTSKHKLRKVIISHTDENGIKLLTFWLPNSRYIVWMKN